MRNWAKNTSRAALVAASAVAVGAGFGSAGAVAHADMRTSGNFGVLNGNQISVPIDTALNVCGVSAAVLGKSQALAKCEAEIKGDKGGHDHGGYGHRSASTDRGHGRGNDDFDMRTSGNFGVLNGNQVYVPVNLAANVCGVSAGVVGQSQAFAKCEAEIGDGDRPLPPTRRVGGTPNPGDLAAGVTSTLEQVTQGAVKRTTGSVAEPVATPVANERSAEAVPAAKPGKVGSTVRRLVGSLTRTASKTGVADVQADDIETSLPLDEAPLGTGVPSIR